MESVSVSVEQQTTVTQNWKKFALSKLPGAYFIPDLLDKDENARMFEKVIIYQYKFRNQSVLFCSEKGSYNGISRRSGPVVAASHGFTRKAKDTPGLELNN